MKLSTQQWFQRNGMTVLIGMLSVSALIAIGLETRWGTSLNPAPEMVLGKVSKSDDTSLLPAFALPPIDAGFKETVERPLFLPTRRPVPVVTGAVQPMMKKGQYRLAGTVVNQELPVAFLVEIATGKSVRVVKGAEIVASGISVSSVDASRVVLKQGDETEELTLRTAASPPPQATLPPGVPPASAPGPAQRPPPSGVVISGVPTFNAPGPAPRLNPPAAGAPPAGSTLLQPSSSAMPGFVLSPPEAAPNTSPPSAVETPPGNPRRRRIQNTPQQ
jgi:hypothetical protein